MSVKNRRNEYNRQVRLNDDREDSKKIPISPRLMEEFGKEKTTGKGKDKETHTIENTDDLPEE